jgi:hypothetical protein
MISPLRVAISTGQRNTPTLYQQKVRYGGIRALIHCFKASRLEMPKFQGNPSQWHSRIVRWANKEA